ncbi:hypothetical protein GCM10022222_04120 [Amycolatopsis ultiminotia]|uniref:Uncharacterized protein n=1 Tax=Amycolatopsis ultiminotia TaxID=543629 RepID=A0ABP6V090_9PSEU
MWYLLRFARCGYPCPAAVTRVPHRVTGVSGGTEVLAPFFPAPRGREPAPGRVTGCPTARRPVREPAGFCAPTRV